MSHLSFQCQHRFPGGFSLDASFEAGDGVTGLFGPSGAGKSTVLGILTGILRPTSGCIRLGEHTLLDTQAGIYLPPERRHMGMVFQDHLLFPHMTVKANLSYGLKRRPTRPVEFDRLVELLELGPLLDRQPHTLSGGQRQRTALGRAILSGPEMLLMDEPLTALDAPLKERILTYLERIIGEWRIPTLFVSHDQADVRRLADHVIVLEGGTVIDSGPTDTSLDRAVITRMASHPGPVNLLRLNNLRERDGHWEGQLGEHWLHLPARPLAAGPSVFVQVLPKDIILSRVDTKGLSARIQLRGQVREVIPVNGRVFVAIDVGQFLWAEVTREAALELELSPGAAVTCLIKSSALQPLG